MKCSHDSLSVVLPIHNDPVALDRRVSELLEILPDLTDRFEILILDNGSNHPTEETAHELVRSFPQVRVSRQPGRADGQVVELGMTHTRGELVIVFDEQTPISPRQLREMWELRKDEQLVIARADSDVAPSLIDRLRNWASQLQDADAESECQGLQVIRRPAVRDLAVGEVARDLARVDKQPVKYSRAPIAPIRRKVAPSSIATVR